MYSIELGSYFKQKLSPYKKVQFTQNLKPEGIAANAVDIHILAFPNNNDICYSSVVTQISDIMQINHYYRFLQKLIVFTA